MNYNKEKENHYNITHVKECKKIYRPLMKLTLDEAYYVENKWQHACFSAYNIIPSESNKYDEIDAELTLEEIKDIINAYGVEPPRAHWYWNELSLYMYNIITERNFHNYLEKSTENIERINMPKEHIDSGDNSKIKIEIL